MTDAIATLVLVPALVICLATVLAWVRRRYQPARDNVVDAIDALLPQTQCAQCGYPGCRPYAEAIAAGAALDLCPPGGRLTQDALAHLLGRSPGSTLAPHQPVRAVIDEARCIGCFLCVDACPVDAIVGAPQWLHTVIENRCTGCELCLPPCPMDCIDLVPLQAPAPSTISRSPPGTTRIPVHKPVSRPDQAPDQETDQATERTPAQTQREPHADAASSEISSTPPDAPCIRCGRCQDVCPEALEPEMLWWVSRGNNPEQARHYGLDDCIECGLCDQVCPSGIDLLATFRQAKAAQRERDAIDAAADHARALHAQRQAREAREALIASDRRRQRLDSSSSRTW